MGKTRSARIATNLPEAMESNIFVYETDTNEIDRVKHVAAPPPLPDDATEIQKICHAWQMLESSVYFMTQTQGTQD